MGFLAIYTFVSDILDSQKSQYGLWLTLPQ